MAYALFFQFYLAAGAFLIPITYLALPSAAKDMLREQCEVESDAELMLYLIVGAFIWPIPVILVLAGYRPK